MQFIEYPSKIEWEALIERPELDALEMDALLDEVFNAVKKDGDAAVNAYCHKYDKQVPKSLSLTKEEIKFQASSLTDALRAAIDLAYANILAFHRAQITPKVGLETQPGVYCWQEKKPISKVGLYIPGGSAPLFSTVLMLAIPAQIAGCTEIVLCSPPNTEGTLHPAICYAALKCGVTKVCPVGGIQAIAAMTFGTESITSVYKIFGPGNQYVTKAKQWALRMQVAIDMPAGPSELLVVADDTANASFVASDLLSQAEHGPDSQVLLISDSSVFLGKVVDELSKQLQMLPRRAIAEMALKNSRFILLKDKQELLQLVNDYGPEHLIICHREEPFFLTYLENAGSVFLGNYTPESAGDYASGTNHTLPTNGFSKQYSGVNLDSFMKTITYQRISSEGLKKIGPAIEIMADAEGLEAHKQAVSIRLGALSLNDI